MGSGVGDLHIDLKKSEFHLHYIMSRFRLLEDFKFSCTLLKLGDAKALNWLHHATVSIQTKVLKTLKANVNNEAGNGFSTMEEYECKTSDEQLVSPSAG